MGLHKGLGEEHPVRERCTNGSPLVDEPHYMITDL